MDKKHIKVGLLGVGTVGSGVYEIIEFLQADEFIHTIGANISIKSILVRNIDKYRDHIKKEILLTDQADDILQDPDIDIVVEVMGGIEPAKTYIERALKAKKSVVSANKDLIAVHGQSLVQLAKENKVDFLYEAAVMGAVPIMRPIQECLIANHISEMVGIQNGTTNYILTKMTSEGWTFEKALEEATRLGYAEADPTADIEGLDAGRKVAILATSAFHTNVVFDNVYTEGITSITPEDIIHAKNMDCVIKLLGIAKLENEQVEVRVHPALIHKEHPLAAVNDSFNALFVRGDAVDDAMFYGRGAGKLPTASAICGDICSTVRNIQYDALGRVSNSIYKNYPVLPIEETQSRFYVRLTVKDTTGVLASIADVFSKNNVSIAMVDQTMQDGNDLSELVIVTHKVKEKEMNAAITIIRNIDTVVALENMIRVYGEI